MPISAFQKAATDIGENKLSFKKGAEKHGIDRMTLKIYLEKVAKDLVNDFKKISCGVLFTQKSIYCRNGNRFGSTSHGPLQQILWFDSL